MKTLYKVDTSGATIRQWSIYTENEDVICLSGTLGGKMVTNRKPCKGKNIGKSNETTPSQQALLEMQSKINKKLDEQYVEISEGDLQLSTTQLIQKIIDTVPFRPVPMLAKPYEEKHLDSEEGVLESAKLDGMRCAAVISKTQVVLWSRAGKKIEYMDHIEKELLDLHNQTGFEGVLDGELYIHSDEENFQEIISSIKKRDESNNKIQYWIYDLYNKSEGANNRYHILVNLFGQFEASSVKLLAQNFLSGPTMFENIRRAHETNLSNNFEGTMLKRANSFYKEGRTADLLKYKDFIDEEFEIIDIVPMDNRPLEGKAVMRSPNGIFEATPAFTRLEKEHFLRDKDQYIGSMATIKYFSLTDSGLPRFPVLKSIRSELEIQ